MIPARGFLYRNANAEKTRRALVRLCLSIQTAAWLKMTFLDMHGCIWDIHPHINMRCLFTDKQTHCGWDAHTHHCACSYRFKWSIRKVSWWHCGLMTWFNRYITFSSSFVVILAFFIQYRTLWRYDMLLSGINWSHATTTPNLADIRHIIGACQFILIEMFLFNLYRKQVIYNCLNHTL